MLRQLFDQETWTFTYLVADEQSRKAVLIDPVKGQVERDLRLIEELGLELVYVLDTHVHADHVTGAGTIAARTGARSVQGLAGAECANIHVEHADVLEAGGLRIEVIATPGHTDDSLSFRIGDMVFTGDALFVRGCGRTDFQNGDAGQLYDSITHRLFTLPDHVVVYPGHDYRGMSQSTIGEEKAHNPRVAGKTREEFIHIMNNLNLANPKYIDVAVPANRACGLDAPGGALH